MTTDTLASCATAVQTNFRLWPVSIDGNFFCNDAMEFEWREAVRGPAPDGRRDGQRNRLPQKPHAYPQRRKAGPGPALAGP